MKILLLRILVMVLALASFSVQASIRLPTENGETVELYAESYALVIGVSDYENWPDLPGVEEDIELVGKSLKQHGFKVITLLNPTRRSFDETMRNFIGDYGQAPENRLLVYYAGHGHTLTTRRGRELGYLVPTDAPLPEKGIGEFKKKAISMLEVEIFAKQMESKHAMFLFDSCFSGSLFAISRAIPASITAKTAEPVRQFITAGSAEQTVPDKSVFRRQFIAGLEGDADLNGDGFITGTELAQYIEDSVTNYTRSAQTPKYGKIRDPYLDKGDFVFLSPKIEITINVKGSQKQEAPVAFDPAAIELSFWDTIKDSNDVDSYNAYLEKYPEGQFASLAKILIKNTGNAATQQRRLSRQRQEEERQLADLRKARKEEFAQQQALLKQQQRDNAQRMAAFEAEQQRLAKQREAEEARLKDLLEQQRLAFEKQQALAKSRQQVAMVAPATAAAQTKKIAVLVRGEAKFGWDINESQFTRVLAESYKAEIEKFLPGGSTVTAITESSNNYNVVYESEDSEESKRICREQIVDAVIIGFVENVSETQWPSYLITYLNCGSGKRVSNSYSLDKHKNDKYRFERSVKRGLKDFWRYHVSADL